MPTVVDLGAIGTQGFAIQGDAGGDAVGYSVAAAGDFNGDGFDDIIIGAPFADAGGTDAGTAYLIFGRAGGVGTIDLGNLQAAQGFRIVTGVSFDYAGISVAGAGDINGDGFDDIVVGSSRGGFYYASTPRAYVIFGKASSFETINLANLAAGDGFVISGQFGYNSVPMSIAMGGDINGDGFDDILLGVPDANNGTGASYVIFGRTTGFSPIDLTSLSPSVGFMLTGAPGDYAGRSVSFAGDVNGDGFDDLIIGATGNNAGGIRAGSAYVVFGHSGAFGTVDLANLSAVAGFVIQGDAAEDFAGFSVSGAGDVNGDGFDDLIVGAFGGDNGGPNAGEAYVIFGRASGFGTIDLSNLAAGVGFIIQGDTAGDRAGISVSAAGDVNRDGFDDLIIGASGGGLGGVEAGQGYVIFGHSGAFGLVDLTTLASSAGFVIQGDTAFDHAGFNVSSAGDINNDGFMDILISAHDGDDGGDGAGEAYVIFGGSNATTIWDVRDDFNGDGRSDILWRNVDGQLSNWLGTASGGFTQNNANAATVVPTAWFVAGTGDFNGDGRDDILWRNVDGQLSNWLGTANGGFTPNNANAAAVVPTAWQIVGTGDFNGDGRDDILWRNNDGTLSNWLGTAAGGFTPNDANAATFVPTAWHVAGTGDFNGDGRDDILWRNDNGQLSNWLGQANGGFTPNNANAAAAVLGAWQVVGTGDFNGDGRDDILWRHTDGTLSNWLGNAAGGFTPNDANAAVVVPTAWTVVAVGDYNGDGRDDILWRHTDGTLSNWLGTASGGFNPNDANAAAPVPTSWQVQPEPFLL